MSLPGFTAEESLYKTKGSYGGYDGAAGGTVAPAAISASQCGFGCYLWVAEAGGTCGQACIASLALAPAIGPAEIILFGSCLVACGGATAAAASQCPPCPGCDTCTDCHSTDIGWCFCSGQNCGWNSPCCAPPQPPGCGGNYRMCPNGQCLPKSRPCPPCGRNQKCCEPGDEPNTCTLCWPSDKPCP